MQEGTTQGDYEWFSGRGTGGVVQIPRYQCHIEIESGQRISDIYARILASCAGARFEWQDRIRYRVGIRRAVSLRVLEQDVIAFESVVPITDLGARINKYTARMTQSEQNDWLPDTVAYEDSAARARDGELRTTEYTLDAVTDPIQASNITSVMLRQGRVNGAWVVRVGYFPMMEQADAATYDIWEITHRALGLDRQRVEVQWARVQPDGTVVALVHEHPNGHLRSGAGIARFAATRPQVRRRTGARSAGTEGQQPCDEARRGQHRQSFDGDVRRERDVRDEVRVPAHARERSGRTGRRRMAADGIRRATRRGLSGHRRQLV